MVNVPDIEMSIRGSSTAALIRRWFCVRWVNHFSLRGLMDFKRQVRASLRILWLLAATGIKQKRTNVLITNYVCDGVVINPSRQSSENWLFRCYSQGPEKQAISSNFTLLAFVATTLPSFRRRNREDSSVIDGRTPWSYSQGIAKRQRDFIYSCLHWYHRNSTVRR